MKRQTLDKLVMAAAAAVGMGIMLATCSGCQSMTPIVEATHTSHATQHFGSNRGNAGWNMVGAGVRIRPYRGVTIDLVESYSFEPVNGRHEVFTGRMLWEVGK